MKVLSGGRGPRRLGGDGAASAGVRGLSYWVYGALGEEDDSGTNPGEPEANGNKGTVDKSLGWTLEWFVKPS